MAAHTEFKEKELEKIVSRYNIGEYIKCKPFKAGYVQTNILIVTKKGKYVLRYYENRIKKNVIFEVELLDYLKKHKYPCAHPVKDKKGKIIQTFKRKPFILFGYVEGRHYLNLNDKQLYQMIKHLALLHNLTEGLKTKNYKLRQPRTKKFCLHEARVEAKRFKDDKGKKRLKVIKDKLSEISFSGLPKGIIHGDFDKSNIKFKGNKLTGVLDFDDAAYAPLVYDLGVVLLVWTRFYSKRFNAKKAKKIIKIYERYRPLTKREKNHLYDAFCFHGLMMMSWLMYDKWKGKDLFVKLKKILEEVKREDFDF